MAVFNWPNHFAYQPLPGRVIRSDGFTFYGICTSTVQQGVGVFVRQCELFMAESGNKPCNGASETAISLKELAVEPVLWLLPLFIIILMHHYCDWWKYNFNYLHYF